MGYPCAPVAGYAASNPGRKSKCSATLEAAVPKLEAFAETFGQLAKTRKLHALADEFADFVRDATVVPITRADLEPLLVWLGASAEAFGSAARTAEQKQASADFKEFVAGMERGAAVKVPERGGRGRG